MHVLGISGMLLKGGNVLTAYKYGADASDLQADSLDTDVPSCKWY
jgi:hypothetical protein